MAAVLAVFSTTRAWILVVQDHLHGHKSKPQSGRRTAMGRIWLGVDFLGMPSLSEEEILEALEELGGCSVRI